MGGGGGSDRGRPGTPQPCKVGIPGQEPPAAALTALSCSSRSFILQPGPAPVRGQVSAAQVSERPEGAAGWPERAAARELRAQEEAGGGRRLKEERPGASERL